MEPAQPGITRRTVLTAAAWSTPVIVAAVASPAATASGGGDLDLTVSLAPLSSARIKSHEFGVKVYDGANSGSTWSGSFDLEYLIAPDDSVVFIEGYSNFGVGSGSTPGWSYVGPGSAGPNGEYGVKFSFSGVIAAGSAATLYVSNPYYIGIGRSGPSSGWPTSPYPTTRSAVITNVAGVPNTDTATGNTVSAPIDYTW
ncbi:hypothetical protein ACF044_10085 [Microbacterium sp. NPDC016588]